MSATEPHASGYASKRRSKSTARLPPKTKRHIKMQRKGPISARYGPPTLSLPPDKRANRLIFKRTVSTVFFTVTFALFFATEAAAATFHWSRALAEWQFTPFVYAPWAICIWLYQFATHPITDAMRSQVALCWAYFVLACLLAAALIVDSYKRIKRNIERPYDIEGSQHWMTPQELRATEFLNSDPMKPGIYIGEWSDPDTGEVHWLRDTTDRHVGMQAPTRAGKGVSVIIPTILTWEDSLVANDPKGELYEICARARIAKGQYALKHDPVCVDGSGARFNVLDEIRKGTYYETKDAMQIALFLVDQLGQGLDTGGDNDHWRKVAWGFLTGAILHIIHSPHERDKTLHGLDAFIDSGVRSEDQVLREMLTTEHDPTYRYGWTNERNQLTKTHPIVAAAARAMINRPPTERGSAMSSAKSYTSLYKDEIIAENTSTSDFSIDDLMHNAKGVSLFLVNTPQDMIRVRGHMRMVINLINSRFTGKVNFDWDNGNRGRQKRNYAKSLLFAQDEFTSTHGKLDTFANALAFHAGYGIRCLIVAQDYSQLEDTYGDYGAQAIISNLHTNIFYATTNDKTAKRIEAMLGDMTIYVEDESVSKSGKSISRNFKKRQMLTANEFMAMDDDDGIAIVAGQSPMYLKKIRYFKEPAFAALVAKAPDRSQVIPVEDRAYTKRLRILQAENELRIQKRKENANGYAPPNVFPGDEDTVVSESPSAGQAPTHVEPAFTAERPAGAPPAPKQPDMFDAGLDQLEAFAYDDDEDDVA